VPLEVSAVDGEDDVGGLDDGSHGAALGDAELVYSFDRDRCDERVPLASSTTFAMASPRVMLVTRAGIWLRALIFTEDRC
jgi:hypothetical protein